MLFHMNVFNFQNNENVDSKAFKWMRQVKDQIFIGVSAYLSDSFNLIKTIELYMLIIADKKI